MTSPEQSEDRALLTSCRALSVAMDLFEERAAQILGLNRSDLRALNLLENGPMRPADMARALHVRPSVITSLLDRLEQSGLIERAAVPGDRRGSVVSLQPRAWRAFASVYQPLGLAIDALDSRLSKTERASARVVLEAIKRIFTDSEGVDEDDLIGQG